MLNNSQKADLVRATLATLAAYLTWVPLGYVLESNIAELLLKLFPPAPTRNLALQCLTEVRSLPVVHIALVQPAALPSYPWTPCWSLTSRSSCSSSSRQRPRATWRCSVSPR